MPRQLLNVLREPGLIGEITLLEWDLILRQARATGLLAKLAALAGVDNNSESAIPAQVYRHLNAGALISQKQHRAVAWECAELKKALLNCKLPLVLLKGAAYVAMDLPASRGRLMSDIDILVPANSIVSAETWLRRHGWAGMAQETYDERYYRQWMHEIPPLQHLKRKTTLDVHHTILPPTAKFKPDAAKLLGSARLSKLDDVYVLCPEDMVIHSVTHLFHEGEFDHGLRDLVDMHELLNHFGDHEPGFWERVVPRAIELDLIRPLYYGLHYVRMILETHIPDEVLARAEAGRPNWFMSRVMDFLFMKALMPDHPSCDKAFTGISRWLLYIRSHYLRMPLHLLVPHLVRKAWKRRFDSAEALAPVAGEEQ